MLRLVLIHKTIITFTTLQHPLAVTQRRQPRSFPIEMSIKALTIDSLWTVAKD